MSNFSKRSEQTCGACIGWVTDFSKKRLTDFWLHILSEYPGLTDAALKHLLSFAATYNCKIGFSTLVVLKTKRMNQLNVEPDMRLKLGTQAWGQKSTYWCIIKSNTIVPINCDEILQWQARTGTVRDPHNLFT
jgi:hypothetical protein